MIPTGANPLGADKVNLTFHVFFEDSDEEITYTSKDTIYHYATFPQEVLDIGDEWTSRPISSYLDFNNSPKFVSKGVVGTQFMLKGDQHFYRWELERYPIYWISQLSLPGQSEPIDVGTIPDDVKQTYTKADPSYTPPPLSEVGFIFNGWIPPFIPHGNEGAVTFSAQWDVDWCSVTWDATGRGVPQTQVWGSLMYGLPLSQSAADLPSTSDPTEEYVHLGWFTSTEGGEQVTPDTIVSAKATTFYAKFGPPTYVSVTFHDNIPVAITYHPNTGG